MGPQINVSLHVTCLKQFKMSPWALLRRLCALLAQRLTLYKDKAIRASQLVHIKINPLSILFWLIFVRLQEISIVIIIPSLRRHHFNVYRYVVIF